jgi:diguanylate cyclase (GGDEF)-like protein
LATLSGTSSVTPAQRQPAAPRHIVLVGPQAQAAKPLLEQLLRSTAPNLPEPEFLTPASFLEAALITGEHEGGDPARLIVAGIPTDEDFEPAIRSLRRINPHATIVLLCEPAHEALCRKARALGADDYFIVPLDAASARQLLATPHSAPETVRRPTTVAATTHPAPGADLEFDRSPGARRTSRASAEIQSGLPSLPLLVQTELLEELFTERTDFPDRALAVITRYIRFNGTLRFVPANPASPASEPESPTQIRRPVAIAEQQSFGTLVLEVAAPHHATPQASAVVAQAANWLAGMLVLLRRYEQLRSLAITDELSGAFNRRYFLKYMSSLLEKAKENRSRVTLLLFDIDDFKRYNDTFGHASGDAIIRELIKLLRACTREYDLVARIGGDEFAVVYRDNEAPRQPNSEHPKDVLVATERFREAIKNHHWPQTCNIKGEVSISGGLATFPWDADNLETLMAKADEALLKAKAAGKNVIVMHAAASGASTAGM